MIFTDSPIKDPKNDKLGLSIFCKRIADVIMEGTTKSDGIVYALCGPWGVGKTSCLNFIQHYIEEKMDDKFIIIRFNPWWISKDSDLMEYFFHELKMTLKVKEGDTKVVRALSEFIQSLSSITKLEKSLGQVLSIILKVSSKAIDLSADEIEEKSLWMIKDEICKILEEQDKRILVIIDDIDRLTFDEIKLVFKLVKSVADFPKTDYLLAFDKKAVTEIMDSDYHGLSQRYLEKIIQMLFDIPQLDKSKIRNFFLSALDDILSKTPEYLLDMDHFSRIFWLGIDPFLNSFRDAKRLLNSIYANYCLVEGEVNPIDFIALETLRLNAPEVFTVIMANQDKFIFSNDASSKYKSDKISEIKDFHKTWYDNLKNENKDDIRNILIILFPSFGQMFRGFIPKYPDSIYAKNLRICSKKVFSTFFRLTVPEEKLSAGMMRKFLHYAESHYQKFCTELSLLPKQKRPNGVTDVRAFLERLVDFIDEDLSEACLKNILYAFFDIGELFIIEEDEGPGLFDVANTFYIDRIIMKVLKNIETTDKRFKFLKDASLKGNALSIITRTIDYLSRQHGNYGSNGVPEELRLITLEQVNILEEQVAKRIESSIESKRILSFKQMSSILYRLLQWKNEADLKEPIKLSGLLDNDKDMADFISKFIFKSKVQGSYEVVPRKETRMKLDDINPFIETQEVYRRCKKLIQNPPEWFHGKREEGVRMFMEAYKKKVEAK